MRALAVGLSVVLGAALLVGTGAPASASDEVYYPPASGAWQVEGRGYGHGIGMSQWGSQGAALKGLSAGQILDFYYPATYSFNIGQDYPLRVRLLWLAGASVSAGPVPGATLILTDVATGTTATAPAGTRVQVVKSGAGFTATAAGSAAPLTFGGGTAVVGPVQIAGSGASQVWAYAGDGSGRRYAGTLRATSTGASSLEVINNVPMEQYLRGVVPQESPASWAIAALKAQAVAARSYALAVRQATGSADLCDTTACQVYNGAARSTSAGVVTELHRSRTDAAVAETTRIARYYGGGPAFTQFSSSNGGYSKMGSRPYLIARADPYTGTAPGDTVSRWTGTLNVASVQASCPSGGTLRRMVVLRAGIGEFGGRIASARLECSTGTATVSLPRFGMRSNWWRLTPAGGGDPVGQLDTAAPVTGGVRVTGWAVDPDADGPVDVHVYVDAGAKATTANLNRPDLAPYFTNAAHGYDLTVPAAPGVHRVCAYAINVPVGNNPALGCRSVTVANSVPLGRIETITTAARSVTVTGWTLDPDTTASIAVHVYVDGGGKAAVANIERPDLARYFTSTRHGFTVTVPATPGPHIVCAYGINTPAGNNPALDCRVGTVG